jgi:ParB/RepB/Spo0J family partition protein
VSPSRRGGLRSKLAGEEVWHQLVGGTGAEPLDAGRMLPVAALDPNPEQPRKAPPDPAGIAALADSIEAFGLLQPVVVAPAVNGRYTLVAGHRRLAAYRLLAEREDPPTARWVLIPALERKTPSADRLVLALVENLSREDLTDAEIVAGLSVLRDLQGWSQDEIARRIGVTKGWISKYFRVAGDPDVAPHVQQGALATSKAYEIVVARDPEAKARALEAALSGAPKPAVHRIAKGADGPTGDAAAPEVDARFPRETGPDRDFPRETAPAPQPVASAPPEAGARDAAEVAAELGLTIDLQETQQLGLYRAAVVAGTRHASLADFIRRARADLRMAEALVRTAPRPRGRRAGGRGAS